MLVVSYYMPTIIGSVSVRESRNVADILPLPPPASQDAIFRRYADAPCHAMPLLAAMLPYDAPFTAAVCFARLLILLRLMLDIRFIMPRGYKIRRFAAGFKICCRHAARCLLRRAMPLLMLR